MKKSPNLLTEGPSKVNPSSDNALRDYLINIGQYDVLTAEQEIELARRYRENGDLKAREQLINHNLKLVISIAKKYKNAHLSLHDLICEGNIGLITAVDRFNPDLGHRFSTCAVPWIKQAILKALGDNGRSIRLPAHITALMKKYREAINALVANNEVISDEKIAKMINTDVEKVAILRTYKHDAISLSTPIGMDGNGRTTTLEDLYAEGADGNSNGSASNPVIEQTEQNLLHEAIIKALKGLKGKDADRTAKIIKLRYGIQEEEDDGIIYDGNEHTLEEIGQMLNLTRERVRQIEKKALAELKEALKSHQG